MSGDARLHLHARAYVCRRIEKNRSASHDVSITAGRGTSCCAVNRSQMSMSDPQRGQSQAAVASFAPSLEMEDGGALLRRHDGLEDAVFNKAHTAAVTQIQDDLYGLSLADARVVRLTRSEGPEGEASQDEAGHEHSQQKNQADFFHLRYLMTNLPGSASLPGRVFDRFILALAED